MCKKYNYIIRDMDLGERFKTYRLKQKLSQKEAADLIGVKSYQLANYETNRSEPSIQTLKNMSMVYHVSIDKLVNNVQLDSVSIEEQKVFEEEKALFAKKLEEILEALKDWEVNDTKKYPGEE